MPPLTKPPMLPVLEAIHYEDQLVSRSALARWVGVTEDCLGVWARQGRGPQPIRVGQHKTAYQVGSVLKWLANQTGAPGKPRRRGTKTERKSA